MDIATAAGLLEVRLRFSNAYRRSNNDASRDIRRRFTDWLLTLPSSRQVRQVDDDVGFMRISSQMFERLYDWQQVWAKPLAAFNE